MSWEESEPENRPCPCGKGRYTVVRRSDDWGRFDEHWAMHCPRCKADYALYIYHANRKGITETHHGWVQKSLLRELTQLQEQTDKEKQRLATYLRTKYAGQWHQYFTGKTKKTIWEELTQNGSHYPSLPTFYNHVRHSVVQNMLNSYLEHHNVGIVIRVLGLDDRKLTSVMQGIQDLEKAAENKERHVRQQTCA